jgi:riboflavin kinase/FMN adenylyltransferase
MKTKFSILTIGSFDGVHKAHQELIKQTVRQAKKENCKSIIVALQKPIKNVEAILSLPDEKLVLIEKLMPDEIIIIPVPSEILSQKPSDFLKDFVIGYLNAKEIICGKDFAFGKDRKGNALWLKNNSKKFGIKTTIIKPLKYKSKLISSTLIRDLIKKNNIEKANELLGRKYSLYGLPFKDKGLATKLGFATINLKIDQSKLLPKGVFISLAQKKEKLYPAITNIGLRPTVEKNSKTITEVHLLNFNGTWTKTKTTLHLIKRLRSEKKFPSIEKLKSQIAKDKAIALNYFQKNNHSVDLNTFL